MTTACRSVLIVACLAVGSMGASAQQKAPKAPVMQKAPGNKVAVWLTDPSDSIFFKEQRPLSWSPAGGSTSADGGRPSSAGNVSSAAGDMHSSAANASSPTRGTPASAGDAPSSGMPVITIDPSKTFQSIDGWGWALTGGSAGHIFKMSAPARAALLKELFGTGAASNQIGGSYLRISIGASDLSDHVFSYDDLPAGQTDTALTHFDLGPDRQELIPVLKEILVLNPAIKILASPWSPPAWMKTTHDTRGGSLLPKYYGVYAHYFVRYIQAMQKAGIPIDAITVQNEPLHPGNEPSLLMPAMEQAAFIKEALGPAFRQAGLKTKIIIYDHNADKPEYPISILDDADARQYVDGSAFHLYAGKIDALSEVHAAHPEKNLYFTEQWVGAPGNFKKDIPEHVGNLIIGATRNWAKTVIEWNLSSNPSLTPHTDRGGCDRCLGAVTIDGDKVVRNPAYYIIAHAAKFVRPGSVRIASSDLGLDSVSTGGLRNVAFRTPAGKIVLIVLNEGDASQAFTVRYGGRKFEGRLNAGAVVTYVW